MSTGFFDADGAYYKSASAATEFIRDEKCSQWLEDAVETGAICGHTRAASRGNVCTDNAHPFRYGGDDWAVCGSHNGHCQAPVEYAVDSMYLFHQLSKHEPGEYQKALGDVSGWYAMTWVDTRDKSIYMLNWNGDLCFNIINGTLYYSSTSRHLEAATGKKATVELKHSHVWRVRGKKLKQLTDFTGKVWTKATSEWSRGTASYANGKTAYQNHNYSNSIFKDAYPMAGPPYNKKIEVKHDGEVWVMCRDGAFRLADDPEVLAAVEAERAKLAEPDKAEMDKDLESAEALKEIYGDV